MSGEELPRGWVEAHLGDLVQVVRSTFDPAASPDHTFNYVSLEWVESGTGQEPEARPTLGREVGSAKLAFDKGDILYGKLRPYLRKVFMATRSGAAVTDLVPLRARGGVEPAFVKYLLLSPLHDEYIAPLMKGIAMPRLGIADIEGMPLWLPPSVEQRRIVAKLDELRARSRKAREALDQVPALLDKLKQSVLAAAFRGDLTAEWRAAQPPGSVEPASVLLDRIRAERRKRWEQANPKKKYVEPEPVNTDGLPELPEGWCWAGISDLVGSDRPGMRTGPFGSLLQKSDYRPTGVPVIGIDNIGPMTFLPGYKVFIETDKADELREYDVQTGDILISRSGTVGEVCVAPSGVAPARFSTNIIRVILSKECIDPIFFGFMFVGCSTVLSQVRDLCTGSSRDFLNQSIMSRMAYPVPPRAEQDAILSIIDGFSATWNSASAAIAGPTAALDSLDQSLLAKAFRGELVPQDPNDEPAEHLLARIKAEAAGAGEARRAPSRASRRSP